MSIINNGGAAFPSEQGHTPDGTWNQTYESGMSLRDYFAAAALQGMAASEYWSRNFDTNPRTLLINAAEVAYAAADAMLKTRRNVEDERIK